MAEYAHDTVMPYDKSSRSKKEQVSEMFDDIAVKYDLINRLLSGGTDLRWRKKALQQLTGNRPSTLLDVATGTADVAIMAAALLKPKKIVGIDISEGMLAIGREKVKKTGLQDLIELQTGDSEAIKAADNSFDAVTVAFGVRNFQNLEKGLAEIYRVLTPGGKLVVLEFSKPRNFLVKPFYGLYMKLIAPWVGNLFSKNKSAYQYLNRSIIKFPEGKEFLSVLSKTGFTGTYYKSLSLGICSIYCGIK